MTEITENAGISAEVIFDGPDFSARIFLNGRMTNNQAAHKPQKREPILVTESVADAMPVVALLAYCGRSVVIEAIKQIGETRRKLAEEKNKTARKEIDLKIAQVGGE